ncbi:ABC transporter permease [Rubinisphaera italica]|uniref:ABC transporter permease YtrF n=1 Tax=Rubinisphaera italica TaxID=2527969 RepID=A0A5C5XC38_9PLAN|nr:ABC transporter permease [Rubinisphaera italica]TWT60348.1 ABC transporter permease YtrF precursor [Rubinisphaera italica]
MNLFTIALKSIRQRLLASSLTALSVALGVALMIAVLIANTVVSKTFDLQGFGYDLIVGPQGSELDLVLNTVYRIAPPIENLPYRYYEELKENKHIGIAVPIALGDSTEQGNFPILGTTVEYFAVEYAQGKKFRTSGEWPNGKWESVIGSSVARENNWKIGDEFQMVHAGQDDHVHDEKFKIVGILEATATPNDRTVFVNLNGFYAIAGHEKPIQEAIDREMEFFGETEAEVRAYHAADLKEMEAHAGHDHSGHDHAHHHDHATPDLQKEVTAILVRMKEDPKNPTLAQSRAIEFSADLKEGFKAQAVNPIRPMQRLMTYLVGNVRLILINLTAIIIVVSGVSIFVSIYNSMSERKREIAIMRALGADRMAVFSIILTESIILCLAGGIIGILLGHGLIMFASPILEASTGLIIDPLVFDPMELTIIPVMIGLAALVGFIPGLTAYRTDVAENLSS